MCARGVSALDDVTPIIKPVKPACENQQDGFESREKTPFGPCNARKHARDAPAGPVPTIKISVLIKGMSEPGWIVSGAVVGSTLVGEVMVEGK